MDRPSHHSSKGLDLFFKFHLILDGWVKVTPDFSALRGVGTVTPAVDLCLLLSMCLGHAQNRSATGPH